MKKLALLFFLLSPLSALASGVCYEVSGAGTEAVNGLYTDTGIFVPFTFDSGGGICSGNGATGINVYTNGTGYLRPSGGGSLFRMYNNSAGSGGTTLAYYSTTFDCGENPNYATGVWGAWTITNTLGTAPPPTVSQVTCPSTNSTFEDSISSASTVFSNTLGTSISSSTEWATSNLLSLFIGSGLALLLALAPWIVALIIMLLIVYLWYATKDRL